MSQQRTRGFTIVELLIVIVVIGILAAITLVAFNGIRDRAAFAQEKSDMAAINKLIQMYHADNGSYPDTGGNASWRGWSQSTTNFVPGIVPKYASSLPQRPAGGHTNESYLYTSNGTDYKLIRHSQDGSAFGLPAVQRQNNPLMDPQRVNRSWGYWSPGAENW